MLYSVSQVSVSTMIFMPKWETTNSDSSSLFAIDLTFANNREGKWLLSNSASLAISMGVTANVIRPVEICKVFHFEIGSKLRIGKYRETAVGSESEHSMLSDNYPF